MDWNRMGMAARTKSRLLINTQIKQILFYIQFWKWKFAYFAFIWIWISMPISLPMEKILIRIGIAFESIFGAISLQYLLLLREKKYSNRNFWICYKINQAEVSVFDGNFDWKSKENSQQLANVETFLFYVLEILWLNEWTQELFFSRLIIFCTQLIELTKNMQLFECTLKGLFDERRKKAMTWQISNTYWCSVAI